MQGRKKNIKKYLAFLGISLFAVFFSHTFATDSVALVFTSQTATASGSNNSLISVDGDLSYVNKGNNSSVIGNYFIGYYYDSIFGYFKTNWSSSSLENVRVISSTSKCGASYGYKLGGYAYSSAFGFVDFDYNSSIFVYYCLNDKKLHGHSYNEDLGFQNLEGITFEIETTSDLIPDEPTGTGAFVNDGITDITDNDTVGGNNGIPNEGTADDSNFTPNTLQNDRIEFDVRRESLFYIIK